MVQQIRHFPRTWAFSHFGLCVLVSIACGIHSYLAYKEIRKISYSDRHGGSISYQEALSFVSKFGNATGATFNKHGCEVRFYSLDPTLTNVAECVGRPPNGGFPSLFGPPSLQTIIFRSLSIVSVIIVVLNVMLFRQPLWVFLKGFYFSPCGCFSKAGCVRPRHRREHIRDESKRCDVQISHEISKQRCQYASKFVRAANHVLMVVLIVSQLRTLLDQFPLWQEEATDENPHGNASSYDVGGLGEALIGSEIVPLCFACSVFLCLGYMHPLPTPSSLDSANVLLSCMWIWRYFTLPRRWYAHWAPVMWASRLIQGIALGNFRLTTVLHITVTMSDCMAHAAHFFDSRNSDEDDEWTSMSNLGYGMSQLCVVFLATGMTHSFEELMRSQAKALVDTKRSNKSFDLVHRLLSAMCDCVVQLDADHCVSKDSPQLSHLLLRRPFAGLLGQRFETMLPEVERERFKNHIAEELLKASPLNEHVPDPSPVRPLHIHMLDANGSRFPVELFCSVVQDSDSGSTCIVGIKDDADAGGWRADANDAPGVGMQKTDQNERKNSFQIDELSCSQTSLDDGVSIVGQDVCELTRIPEGAPAVWLDPETVDLDIVCCNFNFAFLSLNQHLARNAPLRAWMTNQETTDHLMAAMVSVVNEATCGVFQALDIEQVKLLPPGGRWTMEARCNICCCSHVCRPNIGPQIDAEADVEFPLVRLVFTHVKMHRKHRRRISSKSRATDAGRLQKKRKMAIAL